jgi:hypothetical protein
MLRTKSAFWKGQSNQPVSMRRFLGETAGFDRQLAETVFLRRMQ